MAGKFSRFFWGYKGSAFNAYLQPLSIKLNLLSYQFWVFLSKLNDKITAN